VGFGEEQINRLLPRVPTIQLPFTAPNISVPFIGCFPGDGQTYHRKKHGNRPDHRKLDHIKQLKKDLREKIDLLLEGKLDNPARAAAFDARAVRLAQELEEALSDFNEAVAELTEEFNDALQRVNDRQAELETIRAELLAIPTEARSQVDEYMIGEYNACFGELEAQASRLNSCLACLGVF
jgi:chromosome segregation ATPase